MATNKTPWIFTSLSAVISLYNPKLISSSLSAVISSCVPENKKEKLINRIPQVQQNLVRNALKRTEAQKKIHRRMLAASILERNLELIQERNLRKQKTVKRALKKLPKKGLQIPREYVNPENPTNTIPTPSSSPQTKGIVESFLSSIFCCSPKR